MGASAPAGLSRSRATISLCLAKPFAHGERPAQRDSDVVRDAEPVMQPNRRYDVANLCICACQPKREGAMTLARLLRNGEGATSMSPRPKALAPVPGIRLQESALLPRSDGDDHDYRHACR